MTEDQYGQSRGTGYVVRGDAVPDDEEAQAEQATPMTTRLKRVASALRGDRPDEAAPDPEATTPSGARDPNGSQTARPGETGAVRSPVAEEAMDDAGEPDADHPYEGTDAPDPSTTATAGSGPASDRQGLTGTGPDATGARTAEAGDAADAGLRPGEATDRLGDFGDIAFGNLLPDAGQYAAQWQQIQFRFVDDPQGSVTEAADVVSQVTAKLEAAIQERQRAIEERQRAIQERASALRGRWGEGSNADTETLRETLRMYRVFMDQLVGPAR
jgi:hypothetical protein